MSGDLRIAKSLPCLSCGYDLRGMLLSGRCPECGAAASGSLGHLSLADPSQVRSYRRGAVLVAVASAGWPMLAIAAAAASVVAPGAFRPAWLAPAMLFAAALAACPIAGAIGWQLLMQRAVCATADAPSDAGFSGWTIDRRGKRAWTRGLSWTYAGLIGAVIVIMALELGAGRALIRYRPWAEIAAPCTLVAVWSFRNAVGLRVIADLAQRSGAPRLARGCRIWSVAAVVTLGGAVAAGLILLIIDDVYKSYGYAVSEVLRLMVFVIGPATVVGIVTGVVANFIVAMQLRQKLGVVLRAGAEGDLIFVVVEGPESGEQASVSR